MSRYCLTVVCSSPQDWRVQIFDNHCMEALAGWKGAEGARLVNLDLLPERYRRPGFYPCEKHLAWHLILGAATCLAGLDDATMPSGGGKGALHRRLHDVLLNAPGVHMTAEDACQHLTLDGIFVHENQVAVCLDGLTECGLLQRIEVDADNVFYDVDTTPHLHVFDANTRELHDAPGHGLIVLHQQRRAG